MKEADFMRGGEQLVPLSVSPLRQKRARVRCPRTSALRRQPMGCVCVAGNNLIERRESEGPSVSPSVRPSLFPSLSFFLLYILGF